MLEGYLGIWTGWVLGFAEFSAFSLRIQTVIQQHTATFLALQNSTERGVWRSTVPVSCDRGKSSKVGCLIWWLV